MATLEKIRSKSVLLLIIIGVALLAFIIGDFFNSSRTLFGDSSTVAKIDGKKVEAAEYQNRLSAVNSRGGNTDEERAWLNQQVLLEMVMERLQNEEYEKLGLTVTDEELNDAIFGSNSMVGDMLAAQMFGGNFQTAAQLRDYCDNPQKFGNTQASPQELRKVWIQFEDGVANRLLSTKFNNMLSGTLAANKLDIAQMYADDNTGYQISYVKKAYTNDPNIKVTDDEVQKMWDADKANYALDEETRLVGMISLPIAPSTDDEDAARKLVNEVLQSLNSTPELKGLEGKKGFNSQRTSMTLAMVNENVKRGGNSKLKTFADSAAVGSAMIIEEGPQGFQIAKLLGRDVQSDSLTINVVVFAAGDAAKADSVKAAVAAGKKAADLMAMGEVYALDSISTSLTNPVIADPQLSQVVAADFASYKNDFLNAEIGKMFEPDSTASQGVVRLYTVTNRKAPEGIIDMALISYELLPSNATINNLRARLEEYIKNNPTADKFAANAAAANLQFNYYDISASNPYVMMGQTQQGPMFLPNSNAAAVWALEADKGSVSPIFGDERTGALTVASLNDIFTDYRTIADPRVKNDLTTKIRNSKNGDAMIKQYAGKAKDLPGYANAMGGEVASDNVNFSSSVRNYGPELLAKIVTTPKGTFVGPTKGNDGIIVYQLMEVNKPARPVNYETDANAFMMRRGVGMLQNSAEAMFRMMLGDRKFENRLYKVFKTN